MPRIPSVSDVRSVSAAVTRDPGVRATAEDFGLGMAQGLRSMSGDLGRLSSVLKKRADEKALAEKIGQGDVDKGDKGRRPEEEDGEGGPDAEGASLASKVEDLDTAQRKTVAAEAIVGRTAYRVGLRDDCEALIEGVTDPSAEAAKQSHKDLAALEERRREALPAELQPEAEAEAAEHHMNHGVRLAERQQNLRGEAVIAKSEETLARLQAQAVQDPAAAEQRRAEGMETLTRLHEIGALTDAEFTERSGRFTRELYTAVIQSLPAMDAVVGLESGLFDDVLGGPERKETLLTASRWRLQSELEQGKAGVAEMVERARRGEAGAGDLSAATLRVLDAGALADAELEIGAAERAHAIAEERRFAPEAELRALLDDPEPAPGVDGERAQAHMREELGLQVERLMEERREDPAAYVMEQPAVAEAFAAAEQDPTLLPDAIAGRLAAQEALGIKPEDRRVLTKPEEQEIFDGIRNLPPEQQAAALASFRGRYGDRVGPVVAQLEEAGLPPSLVAHLDPSSDPAPVRPVSEVPEPPGESFEGDIIAETAQRLLAEGEAAGEPRAVEQDQSGIAAGQITEPPLPRRKPGSGPHPAEQKLLNKYRPLMEADEATLKEGLDPGRAAAVQALVTAKAAELGARPEITDLARRLSLFRLTARGNLEFAAYAALSEAGITSFDLSTDTRRYLPARTGDPFEDAKTYMRRFGLPVVQLKDETVARQIVDLLTELSQVRVVGGVDDPQTEDRFSSLLDKWKGVNLTRLGLPATFLNSVAYTSVEANRTPYQHQWSLTDPELGTAIVYIARQIEDSADQSLGRAFASFMLDLVPGSRQIRLAASGLQRTLDAIGIVDGLSGEVASNVLAKLVVEARFRGLVSFDPRLLPGIL